MKGLLLYFGTFPKERGDGKRPLQRREKVLIQPPQSYRLPDPKRLVLALRRVARCSKTRHDQFWWIKHAFRTAQDMFMCVVLLFAEEVQYEKDANVGRQRRSSLLVLLRFGSSKTCTFLHFLLLTARRHIDWVDLDFGLNNTAHAISVDEFWWKLWSRACIQQTRTFAVSFGRDWHFCCDDAKR